MYIVIFKTIKCSFYKIAVAHDSFDNFTVNLTLYNIIMTIIFATLWLILFLLRPTNLSKFLCPLLKSWTPLKHPTRFHFYNVRYLSKGRHLQKIFFYNVCYLSNGRVKYHFVGRAINYRITKVIRLL
jgi:hypothetical protein